MTPTKPTQLKHYVDITTKQYLYHIKIFTSVPYKTLFSHVKKTSLNFYKSLSFIASYICICVVIKAIILGHDLLICQLQSQPSRVCLLMSHSSSHPHLSKCRVPFSCCCFFSLRSCSRWPVTMFCLFSAISRDVWCDTPSPCNWQRCNRERNRKRMQIYHHHTWVNGTLNMEQFAQTPSWYCAYFPFPPRGWARCIPLKIIIRVIKQQLLLKHSERG